MAANATMEQVDMVVMVTGFSDRGIIASALQSNNYNVESVINEYLDDSAKFRRTYGWDESAFSSGREGQDSSAGNPNVPSFAIHGPVIYGSEPNGYYAAPSRPPSRVNARSPMSRLVDIASSEYTTDTPSNRQEEEAQLQQAITASLGASGVQSPQTLPPPPPPPPLPQQSGVITSEGESSVYFGPANRPDYDPDEWAMVRLGKQEADPVPSFRARKAGEPVFLRCRAEVAWQRHRLGALLMILSQIPAARNALLRSGEPPDYGYGSKGDWWQGQPILPPPESRSDDGWGTEQPSPRWSDEVHRLIAFLEGTDRSYGTADVLASAGNLFTTGVGDAEKDFFQVFMESQPEGVPPGNAEALISSAESVAFGDLTPQGSDRFGLLDVAVGRDASPFPDTLSQLLDLTFFADPRLARDDPDNARIAWLLHPSQILTVRVQVDDGLPRPVEMPETFYIDRYLKTNGEKMRELQRDMLSLVNLHDTSVRKEEELMRWVDPSTAKVHDRRVLIKAAVRRCQDRIRKIRDHAFWRKHEQQQPADGEGEYYLPDHTGDPELLPKEAAAVAHHEAQMRELQDQLAEMERLMSETVMPERQAIRDVQRKMGLILTEPTANEEWNPTHKYTLRGVVNDPDTVYQRMRRPRSEAEPTPAGNAPAEGEDRWWKISYRTQDNTIEYSPVYYETVMREACGAGSQPILVYATDEALAAENLPLSEALRSFVKLDNRVFKQELLQADRPGHSLDKKRGPVLEADSQAKRLQRSSSMDSMATNLASAGDLDDDMRDAPFDNDAVFGLDADAASATGAAPTISGSNTLSGEVEPIPKSVKLPPPPRAGAATPPPAYPSDVEMETGVSPALAQVSLQDMKGSGGGGGSRPPSPRLPEMQERPTAQFLTRPNPSGTAGPHDTAFTFIEPPTTLIDIMDDRDARGDVRMSGV